VERPILQGYWAPSCHVCCPSCWDHAVASSSRVNGWTDHCSINPWQWGHYSLKKLCKKYSVTELNIPEKQVSRNYYYWFLICCSSGMSAWLWKAPIRFVTSVCPSVHMPTWLPPHGFLWNMILETFMTICQENPNFIKIRKKYWVLYMNA
jgi:hypothetical protein